MLYNIVFLCFITGVFSQYINQLANKDEELRNFRVNYGKIIARYMDAGRNLQDFEDIFTQGVRGY